MTEEVRKCVEILRYCEESGGCCGGCPSGKTNGIPNCCSQSHIADLIESLSAQLDQVTRERDAAVEDVKKAAITLCDVCGNHHTELGCSGNEGEEYTVMACTMFKWRGVEKGAEG